MRKFRIYPSSTGVVENCMVKTSKSSVCHRSKWFEHRDMPRSDIPNLYQLIGDFWENMVGTRIRRNLFTDIKSGKVKINREKSMSGVFEGVTISGRADYLVEGDNGVVVHECKALASSTRRKKCVYDRVADREHIIQTVLTMLLAKSNIGVIHYAFVCYNNEGTDFMVPKDQHCEISVYLSDSGDIQVDGNPWEYNLGHIFEYCLKADREVPSDSLPDRPYIDPGSPYSSPCNRCVFSDICDKTDTNEMVQGKHLSTTELVQGARQCVKDAKTSEAKIFQPKRKLEKSEC